MFILVTEPFNTNTAKGVGFVSIDGPSRR